MEPTRTRTRVLGPSTLLKGSFIITVGIIFIAVISVLVVSATKGRDLPNLPLFSSSSARFSSSSAATSSSASSTGISSAAGTGSSSPTSSASSQGSSSNPIGTSSSSSSSNPVSSSSGPTSTGSSSSNAPSSSSLPSSSSEQSSSSGSMSSSSGSLSSSSLVASSSSGVHVSQACNTFPCLNGGTCIPQGINGFVCDCIPQVTGTLCQIPACIDCTTSQLVNQANISCWLEGPNPEFAPTWTTPFLDNTTNLVTDAFLVTSSTLGLLILSYSDPTRECSFIFMISSGVVHTSDRKST